MSKQDIPKNKELNIESKKSIEDYADRKVAELTTKVETLIEEWKETGGLDAEITQINTYLENFKTAVIEAIVTHVYIEWIHPFGDGNGRTGRLLEFYILLRAGLPSIVSHILSNHYNQTRSEYYRQLDRARKHRNLTEFIQYALQGFRDGLKENLDFIQQSQFSIFWQHYIYETFADLKYTKKTAFKRKRALILQMPIDGLFTVDELLEISTDVAKKYATVGRSTALRDLRELQDLSLLKKIGSKYIANTVILRAMMPVKKS